MPSSVKKHETQSHVLKWLHLTHAGKGEYRFSGKHPVVFRSIQFIACNIMSTKSQNDSNLRKAPRWRVSVGCFAIAVVKHSLAKKFIIVKLLLLTSNNSGETFHDLFLYPLFGFYSTTPSLGMTKFILMVKKFVVLGCQRTNQEAFRYCMKSCSSDSDCKSNQKCLCDEDCGMSCVRNSKFA